MKLCNLLASLLALLLFVNMHGSSAGAPSTTVNVVRIVELRNRAISIYAKELRKELSRDQPSRAECESLFQLLGKMRSEEGADIAQSALLVSSLDPTTPHGLIPISQEYPACDTLVSVGLAGIDGRLQALARKNRVDEQEIKLSAYVIRMTLPKQAALRWIRLAQDGATDSGRSHLEALEKGLDKLPAELFGESARKRDGYRLPEPQGVDDPTYRAWVAAKRELLSTHLPKLGKASLWENQRDEAISIARILGEYRLAEASPLLAPHLLVETPDAIEKDGNLARYPVAEALSKIGLSAVDPMLQQVIQGDQPEATRDVVAQVLADMMPPEVAVTFVDTTIRSQKNELAKQRLVDLREALNKLAEELKEKREKKDQP